MVAFFLFWRQSVIDLFVGTDGTVGTAVFYTSSTHAYVDERWERGVPGVPGVPRGEDGAIGANF